MTQRTENRTKIARILADPRYWDAKHPEHGAITAEATRAFREAYPEPDPVTSSSSGIVHVASYTQMRGGKRVEVGAYDRSARARAGETQTALDFFQRAFIPPAIAAKAQSVIRNLTRLPEDQVRNIYDQVIRNISPDDAKKFANIDPDRSPILLTSEQFRIVIEQLNKLTPADLKSAALTAFETAQKEGRVVVAQ